MKATVANLKTNRNQIINIFTEMFGEENLKSKMRSLLNLVEEAEMFKTHNTIQDCICHLNNLSQTSRRKSSKIADLLAKLNEFELERN
jgi:hypothetical protein